MLIEQFAEKILNFKNPVSLEVYQGYLIAGKVDNKPRCFWINKQNIEGLAEVAKIVAIETTFSAILSLIPGGSFAYRLIKDQIGYPPRYNIIFEPNFYHIRYSFITLDQEGESKGVIDTLVQNVDQLAKFALSTGSKVQESLFNFLSKGKSKVERKKSSSKSQEELPLGFTYVKFEDKTSIIRNEIISSRLDQTKSKSMKVAKLATASLTPSIIVSFKTIANEESVIFLQHLRKLGFKVSFSSKIDNGKDQVRE